MALGDCYSPPCGSPLDFEQVLVGLFGANTAGCFGMKIHLDTVGVIETDCSNMSLQELILNSLVEDGAGGYALRFINLLGTPECYPCGGTDDLESLLKSLFAKQGDCYGVKFTAGSVSCTGVSDWGECPNFDSIENLIRNVIGVDTTYGNVLIINELIESCGTTPGCDPVLDWVHIFMQTVVSVDGECFSAFNLNAIDSTGLASLHDCSTFLSFEEAFKNSLSVVDCGLALNVFLTNGIFRGEEV